MSIHQTLKTLEETSALLNAQQRAAMTPYVESTMQMWKEQQDRLLDGVRYTEWEWQFGYDFDPKRQIGPVYILFCWSNKEEAGRSCGSFSKSIEFCMNQNGEHAAFIKEFERTLDAQNKWFTENILNRRRR